jgi:hypothetical protein
LVKNHNNKLHSILVSSSVDKTNMKAEMS